MKTPLEHMAIAAALCLFSFADAAGAAPASTYASYFTQNGGNHVIDIKFSEAMDPASLANATYNVPGLTVQAVTLFTNGGNPSLLSPTSEALTVDNYASVQLRVSGNTPAFPLALTITGAKDASGNALTTNTAEAVQGPLTDSDIGLGRDPAVPGVLWMNGPHSYTIQCEGSDIWNTADGFNFAYQVVSGDFDVVVQVKDQAHTSNWAKGGLMVREYLDPASRNWNIVADPSSADNIPAPDGTGNGASVIEVNCRAAYAGPSQGWAHGGSGALPPYPNVWLRLKRTGNALFALSSADGLNWVPLANDDPTQVGDKTPLPASVYIGLCQTAHNNDTNPPPAWTQLKYLCTIDYANYGMHPPEIAAQPLSQLSPVGSNATFQVSATGAPPLTYQWQFNGTNLADGARITGSQSNRLVVANLQPGDAGAYQVVVSNPYGSTTSAVATLQVSTPTVSWIGGSGDWNTPSHWSTGALPGPTDDVLISPSSTSVVVTHSSGSHFAKNLICQCAFQLTGGSLRVANMLQVNSMFTLAAGTLAQATVLEGANGSSLVVTSSGTLDGVTVNGVLDVGNSYSGASLTVINGLVLNGTAYVGNPSNGWYGGINFAGSQSLSGNGTVVFGGNAQGANALWLSSGGTTLTIGGGITVRGQNGMVGASTWPWGGPGTVGVVNQGTISADVSGGTIVVTAQPLSNAGVLAASNGGQLNVQDLVGNVGQVSLGLGSTLDLAGSYTNNLALNMTTNGVLNLGGTWVNTGSINAINATVYLGGSSSGLGSMGIRGSLLYVVGSFTGAQIGALQYSGASLEIGAGGLVDNTTNTLNLSGATGSLLLNGGTLRGGIITCTGGAQITANNNNKNTLDGVTVNGVLDVGNSYSGASLTVINGLVLNGTAYVGNPSNGWYGGINFAGSQSLSGNGTVVFGGNAQGANALWLSSGGTTLTIGGGITVRGQNGMVGASTWPWGGPGTVGVVNQGMISADVTGGTIFVNGQPFTNNGLAEALNGGTLTVTGTFTNNGFIGVSGTVNLPSPSGVVTLTYGPPPAFFFGPNLTRLPPPAITGQPQDALAGNGGTATFSVTAAGAGLSYQWQFDGTNLPGATNSTLFLGNVSSALAGSYSVVVSNLVGSTNSAPATLTVLGTAVTPGNVNSTWAAANSPYWVGTNLTVTNLAIQPGVSVLFNGPYSLTVTGLLQAAGTSNNPITFGPALVGTPWLGLRFVSANTNSAVNWCVVRGAAEGGIRFTNTPLALANCVVDSNTGVSGGGLYTDSPLLLQSCTLINNAAVCGQQSSPYLVQGGGLFVAGGNVTLQSCLISNNTAAMPVPSVTNETSTGGGIDCEAGTLTLNNCTVVSNLAVGAGSSSTEAGGGVYLDNVAATLAAHGSVFQGNSAPGGFGGAAAMGNGTLNNCVFSSNAATFGGALWIGGNGQTLATNCLVARNTASLGGAVYSSVGAVAGAFENCTIVRNSPDAFNGYTGVIHDSIVYSNGNEIVVGPVAGPVVSYCDVQGGYNGPGTNNLDVDPQFANTADFELSAASPLIDAGDPAPQFNDQAFPPSQGFDQNDVGAYGGPGAANWPAFASLVPVVIVNGVAATPYQVLAFTNSSPPTISFGNGFPGGTFQYTLDGSNPLVPPAYEGTPFVLTNSAQIRVIAYSADFLSYAISPPVTVNVVPTYTVTASTAGGGGVTPTASTCLSNTVVTLTATNAPGWTFLHWAGDASGTNNLLTLAVGRSLNVQAVFGTPIVVSVTGAGSVQTNPALAFYAYGSTAQLAAVPGNANTYFRAWTAPGVSSTNSPFDFVVTNASPVVRALFAALPAGQQTLNLVVNGAGSVSRNPQASYYPAGSVVTISATPASGNIFTGWSGGITGTNASTNVTLNSSLTITASFLSTNAPPPQPPSVAITNPVDGAEFMAGSSITLAASANDPNPGGTVTQVAFFAGTNQIALLTNSPFSFAWTNAPVGTNVLEAVAVNSSGLSAVSAPVSVTVVVPPPGPPIFSLSNPNYSVLENAGSVTVTVLKNTNSLAGTVNYSTLNGSALALANGVGNYQAASGVLTFAAGQLSTNVTIPILYNQAYEGNITFTFALSPSGDGSTLGSPGSATVTIIDVNQPSTTNSVLVRSFPRPAPESDGQLSVVTVPSSGQWKLVWEGAWHNSGDVILGLPTDNYPVQFSALSGYVAPGLTTYPVVAGTRWVYTNQYAFNGGAGYGSLTVSLYPSSLAGAQWRLQGDTTWYGSGMVLSNLVSGNHIVVFKPVTGWITPAPQVVDVGAGQQEALSATYLVAEQLAATPPTALNFTTATTPDPSLPYAYNGQLLTDVGYGSGCVVQPRVVLTAAHLVFNDSTLSYAQSVNWFFQEYAGTYNPAAKTPAGWYMFSGYAAARTNDASPGVESPASEDQDVAVLFFLEDAGRGGSSGYLVSDANGTQWLQASALKTLVGYPVDNVSQAVVGLMHATTPEYLGFAQVTNNVFSTRDVVGYGGMSGGPLCVQYTDGIYYPAGVYLGGTQNSIVRAIDGTVADMINRADVTSYSGALHVGGGVVVVTSGGGGFLLPVANYVVHLGPPAALAAGAGWKITQLTGTTWLTDTSQTYQLPTGTYTITFRPIPGYLTPTNLTFTLGAGATAAITDTYVALGGPTVPGLGAPAVTNGSLRFTITGSANERVAIQRSTNLVNWTPVVTNTIGPNGSVSFSDAFATNRTRGFYRAQVIP
jgi:hypothetical protein